MAFEVSDLATHAFLQDTRCREAHKVLRSALTPVRSETPQCLSLCRQDDSPESLADEEARPAAIDKFLIPARTARYRELCATAAMTSATHIYEAVLADHCTFRRSAQ